MEVCIRTLVGPTGESLAEEAIARARSPIRANSAIRVIAHKDFPRMVKPFRTKSEVQRLYMKVYERPRVPSLKNDIFHYY
jgi:hypothetical protein